jgi:aminomethyltransferase
LSEDVELKKTPMHAEHNKLGARIIDFGGWAMPVQYSSIIEEHEAVRERAGLFDVSHMGEIDVRGPEALELVNHVITNDASKLTTNQALYSPMCNERGGIVDDLLVYKLADDYYFLVVNAANTLKDFLWIEQAADDFDAVTVENVSDDWSQLALQGPEAEGILQELVEVDLSLIEYFWAKQNVDVAGTQCLVSRTGYTGEDGFEVYCPSEQAPEVWRTLLEEGKPRGLEPVGLGARDTLRFEACLPLYGHELDEDTNPLEARLSYFVELDKDGFIGQEAIRRAKEEGLDKRLVGFEVLGRGIPRHGYELYDADGETKLGYVTSGAPSPTLGKNLGLGYVPPEYAKRGTKIKVKVRRRMAEAELVKTPFYRRSS